MGGMSAILIAMLYIPPLRSGDMLAHKVLAVSIVAGLGNLVGGLVVGLALGVLEALIQGYAAGSWSNAIAFVVMLVVILWKPKVSSASRSNKGGHVSVIDILLSCYYRVNILHDWRFTCPTGRASALYHHREHGYLGYLPVSW
jgi:hypothetical protein